MYIYLDESGDTGCKFGEGSSRYFTVALLLVDDPIPLHQAIHDFRLHLKEPEDHEFKFMRTHHAGRVGFFRAIHRYPYRVRALVVEKQRLNPPVRKNKDTFYEYLVQMILASSRESISNAKLVIDESFKGKTKKAHLTVYLRRALNTDVSGGIKRITDVRYHESHRDNLLQAADMIVGSIAWKYERGDAQYRHIIRKKIEREEVFP